MSARSLRARSRPASARLSSTRALSSVVDRGQFYSISGRENRMRWIGLVVTAVLTASVAQGQTKIEGGDNYQVTTKSGRPMVFDYCSRGGKARIEPHDSSGMVGAVIIDQDAKT